MVHVHCILHAVNICCSLFVHSRMQCVNIAVSNYDTDVEIMIRHPLTVLRVELCAQHGQMKSEALQVGVCAMTQGHGVGERCQVTLSRGRERGCHVPILGLPISLSLRWCVLLADSTQQAALLQI